MSLWRLDKETAKLLTDHNTTIEEVSLWGRQPGDTTLIDALCSLTNLKAVCVLNVDFRVGDVKRLVDAWPLVDDSEFIYMYRFRHLVPPSELFDALLKRGHLRIEVLMLGTVPEMTGDYLKRRLCVGRLETTVEMFCEMHAVMATHWVSVDVLYIYGQDIEAIVENITGVPAFKAVRVCTLHGVDGSLPDSVLSSIAASCPLAAIHTRLMMYERGSNKPYPLSYSVC